MTEEIMYMGWLGEDQPEILKITKEGEFIVRGELMAKDKEAAIQLLQALSPDSQEIYDLVVYGKLQS